MKSQRRRRAGSAISHDRRIRGAPDPLDKVFGALSDTTRRGILRRLARGECSVTTLAEPFAVSPPAISKHLRVLERSGLIARQKVGRVHYCRLRSDTLRRAGDWIQQQTLFWEQQFDALANHLDKEQR